MRLLNRKKPASATKPKSKSCGDDQSKSDTISTSDSNTSAETAVFHVRIPDHVQPGEEFSVSVEGRIVRVLCPSYARGGQSIDIRVPVKPTPSSSSVSSLDSNVQLIPDSDPPAYMVGIPPGVQPGQQFPVHIQGQTMAVICPPNAYPGLRVRMVPPAFQPPSATTVADDQSQGDNTIASSRSNKSGDTALFRARIPDNVRPGEEFSVSAEGRIVRVMCPLYARGGQSIDIRVPLGPKPSSSSVPSRDSNVQLIPDSDPPAYMVGIPHGVRPGQQFPITIQGQEMTMICPPNAYPGLRVRMEPSAFRSEPATTVADDQSQAGTTFASSDSNTSTNSETLFHVRIPDRVRPGEEFRVSVKGRIVRVMCPVYARGGQFVDIRVPEEPKPSSSSTSSIDSNVQLIPDSDPPAYMVGIPRGVYPGQQFPITIQGQEITVICPPNAYPGLRVRMVPPALRSEPSPKQRQEPKAESTTFEVKVPRGVQPGTPFTLRAGQVRVKVTCPVNAVAGDRIRFELPVALTQNRNKLHATRLIFDKDGWARTVRPSDLKFQWIRIDENGAIETTKSFHMEKSAYVRKLQYSSTSCNHELSLVPANEAVADSRIRSADGRRDIVSYVDLEVAQGKSFDEKARWFQDTCSKLRVEWKEGHMLINVRRDFLLGDSVDAVMSLTRKDLRKTWRLTFLGNRDNEAIDAGGLTREWFELVCKEIFDPDNGLWQPSATNQMSMTINPFSELCCEEHLMYYRFIGRVMGKAMFDGQLVNGHMVKHIYKYLLGWPVMFRDLESIDPAYCNSLKQLQEMIDNGDDIQDMCVNFTSTLERLGVKEEVELVKGGADIEVTNANFPKYVEGCLQYKLMGQVKSQLTELLLGFYDVIPEPLLTIFDFQELELLMCGLPEIDVDDWQEHTEYSGEYDELGPYHPTCQWFWEVVSEFDEEMKARLLQFVTGTSGVPSGGFGVLQGNDGNIRKFTINGVPIDLCLYPRAHTCFNRIDLPVFDSKEGLEDRLRLAVTMCSTGFDLE